MSLAIAIDELQATGWSAWDTTGCLFDSDGRMFPGPARVSDEFVAAGFQFRLEKSDQFACVKATWSQPDGSPAGSVVGQSDREAAAFALAHLRRQLVLASAV